jgi:hypothetical protein
VEGKCSVFDDDFPHEAWNFSSREQVVLIVNLWRPDLSSVQIELLEAMSRYAGAHARLLNLSGGGGGLFGGGQRNHSGPSD